MTNNPNEIVSNRQRLVELLKSGASPVLADMARDRALESLGRGHPVLRQSSVSRPDGFDLARLQHAASVVSSSADILNYRFIDASGRLLVLRQPGQSPAFAVVNVPDEDFERAQQRELATPIDVTRSPGLRLTLLRGSSSEMLVATTSNYIADEWTAALLLHDIVAVHDNDALAPSGAFALNEAVAQENAFVSSATGEAALQAEVENLFDLTTIDLSQSDRPAVLSQRPARTATTLQSGTHVDPARIRAAWIVLVSRMTHEKRFGLLTRSREGLTKGPVAGSRVAPIDLEAAVTFDDVLQGLTSLDSPYRHGHNVPLAVLVEAAVPDRDLSHTPLAQVGYIDCTDLPNGNEGDTWVVGRGANSVDLTLVVSRSPRATTVALDYNADLISAQQAELLLARLAQLVDSTTDLSTALNVMDCLLPEERRELLARGRGESTPTASRTLGELFVATSREHPQATAIRFQDESTSYAQLLAAATTIAQRLETVVDAPVGLLLTRSPLQVAAMIACTLRGVPFVPVDSSYPTERIEFILADSGAGAVIHDGSIPQGVDISGCLSIGVGTDDLSAPPVMDPPQWSVTPDDTAYVIYTSGSTGPPKGVEVTHRSVMNNLEWRQRVFPLEQGSAVLHNHSFSFDPSIWAVFWPLAIAGRIVLTDASEFDATDLLSLMAREDVTVIGGVPSVLSVLAKDPAYPGCDQLRYVLSGAEALTSDLVRQLRSLPRVTVANLYGPTECTIDATYWIDDGSLEQAAAPIGNAIDNSLARVLDDNGCLAPSGAIGQLAVGGVALAKGYIGDDAKTAERFIDWRGPEGTERLYLTGDLVRWTKEGRLSFHGRADEQVKIRGYRVELGEIESIAGQVEGVAEFIAVASRIDPSLPEMRLTGFYTASTDLTPDALRLELQARLPGYMVPALLEHLDQIPRLPNGKADRNELRRRKVALAASSDEHDANSDTSPLVDDIRREFAAALGTDSVSADTDFFAVGGTSIMIAGLASTLRRHYEVKVAVHELFQEPTPRGVARLVKEARRGDIDTILASRHMEKMRCDAELDQAIVAGDLPWADLRNPQNAFLTGATGYLGSYILSGLLNRTPLVVTCLVRGKDDTDARDRLVTSMSHYGLWRPEFDERVHVLQGDLGSDRYGLSPHTWQTLAETIDVIFHNGALVNFVYPYAALKAPNIDGTTRALELATTRKVKAVHHVSTIDSILATHSPRPFIEDDSPLKNPVGVPGGYTGTKWVAEKLMNSARQRGLPVSIYRPGLILGTTNEGITQTSDYLLVALKGFLPLGVLPDYPRIFDTVPVDYVGDGIAEISTHPESLGRFYHFFNPAPVSIRTFSEWIQEYGFDFDIVPFEEARATALTVREGHPLYSLVPLIRDATIEPQPSLDPARMDELQPILESANTLEVLQDSDVACAPMTKEFAWRCLDYLVEIGFLERPEREGGTK